MNRSHKADCPDVCLTNDAVSSRPCRGDAVCRHLETSPRIVRRLPSPPVVEDNDGGGNEMDRREMLGALGAVGLAASGSLAFAQPQGGRQGGRQGGQGGQGSGQLDQKATQDIETMHECVRICNETAQHCLSMAKQEKDNVEDHLRNHEAVMDCQETCSVTANFMARQSPFSQPMHQANAEICAKCAEICENSQDDSEIVKKCAEICRECEEMCRKYAQKSGQGDGTRGGRRNNQ